MFFRSPTPKRFLISDPSVSLIGSSRKARLYHLRVNQRHCASQGSLPAQKWEALCWTCPQLHLKSPLLPTLPARSPQGSIFLQGWGLLKSSHPQCMHKPTRSAAHVPKIPLPSGPGSPRGTTTNWGHFPPEGRNRVETRWKSPGLTASQKPTKI